jgi:predicted XRE-type DNA-binding protein
MKKKIVPSTDEVLDFINKVEKKAKKGNIPRLLPANASPEEKLKYSLCKLFVRFAVKNEMKSVDLAKMLNLPKTRISDVVNYKIDNYTVDRLLTYAWKLAENDGPTREHLHFVFEFLDGPVRPVKETKKIEKELLKYA